MHKFVNQVNRELKRSVGAKSLFCWGKFRTYEMKKSFYDKRQQLIIIKSTKILGLKNSVYGLVREKCVYYKMGSIKYENRGGSRK